MIRSPDKNRNGLDMLRIEKCSENRRKHNH